MKPSVKFRLSIVSMVILLVPFVCLAKVPGKTKVDVDPILNSDTSKDEHTTRQEPPTSTRFDEQERYNRMLKEYVQAINEAENDEERSRLRREFDEETREYRNSLAEAKDALKKQDIEKEKQALKDKYLKQLRQLEQNHDKNVRRLEEKCRRDAFGVEKNRPDLEPESCKERPSMEVEFKRQSNSLKDDYNASLQELLRK